MLDSLLGGSLFAFLIVFVRLGAALMLMPTIGEAPITPRARLHFALAFTLIVTPLVRDAMPAAPGSAAGLAVLVAGEAVIGLFFGALTRGIMAVLHVAGMVFAFQSSLAAAQLFDPNQSAQTSVAGNFLTLVALVLIFVSDLHHLLFTGLVDTYVIFPVGAPLPLDAGAEAMARVAADSFRVGLQIVTPIVVAGFLLYLAAGLLNRLMPQMMVFFVVLPIQIILAFAVLTLTLSAALYGFITFFDDTLATLGAAG